MSFAAVASQLRAAQESSSSLGSTAQAGAAVASIRDAFRTSTEKAKGALQSAVEEAQVRTNLLTGGSRSASSAAAVVSDGSRCEACALQFGLLRRRNTCGACDRFLCGPCIAGSSSGFSASAGISCFCGSLCARCREEGARRSEFDLCREQMESGVSATLLLPAAPGFFGDSGSKRRLPVWLSLDSASGELAWATLEQRGGRPVDQGGLLIREIVNVQNTGTTLELAMLGKGQPTVLSFASDQERDSWCGYLKLAVEALTPASDRARIDTAREEHRRQEVEERRLRNEERKAKLSENLGMRFTAEAMISRGQAK